MLFSCVCRCCCWLDDSAGVDLVFERLTEASGYTNAMPFAQLLFAFVNAIDVIVRVDGGIGLSVQGTVLSVVGNHFSSNKYV